MWNELSKLRDEYINLAIRDSLDYEKFCMISIVYNSSKIEGCSLSESDTRFLIENNITAKGKPLSDHLLVKDHFEAFNFIKAESINKRKISIDFIQELGSLVMKNTGGVIKTISGEFDTRKGDLRLAQVYVDNKYFPDFKKVPVLLENLIKEINSRIDSVSDINVVKLAADLHYNFVNIHPFADGNGRCSRLLMNFVQLYHNEPLIKIFTEDREDYINALNNAEDKADLNIFRNFICAQQIKYYKAEIKKFKKISKGFTLMF